MGVHPMDEQRNGDGKHVCHGEQRIGQESERMCHEACHEGDNDINTIQPDTDIQHQAVRTLRYWLLLFLVMMAVMIVLVLLCFRLFHSIIY